LRLVTATITRHLFGKFSWRFSAIGGAHIEVIAPLLDEHFSETNDYPVSILLTYGTTRVLLAGDAEVREEEYTAGGLYTRP
jgi:hypothetical protein